jgi:hypothetical protein
LWCCTDFVPFLLHDIDTRANSVRCKLSLFMPQITTSWLLLLTIHGASMISPLVYAWLRSALSFFLCTCVLICVLCTFTKVVIFNFFPLCEICRKVDSRKILPKYKNLSPLLRFSLSWPIIVFHLIQWSADRIHESSGAITFTFYLNSKNWILLSHICGLFQLFGLPIIGWKVNRELMLNCKFSPFMMPFFMLESSKEAHLKIH